MSAALASISDASASKPYVVRIAPGVYTETSTVALKSYVDVEGSGEGVTTITCACGGNPGFIGDGESSTVVAYAIDDAEIRDVTIENTGGGSGKSWSIGLGLDDLDETFSVNNVTVSATGGFYNVAVTMYEVFSTVTNLRAEANGGIPSGLLIEDSAPILTNLTARGVDGSDPGFGVELYGDSYPTIRNSWITGHYSIYGDSVLSTAYVADTVLSGIVGGSSSFRCREVYDASLLGVICP